MNILTFDIEDWWGYDYYSIGKKEDYLPRLNQYLVQILDLLTERNIQATFFCLGKVAEEYSEVIKSIAKRGHQIGCHSYSHRFWGGANPKEVAEDTRKALDAIENLIGEKVTAYRAPAFSIMEHNKWIFEILAENGITSDCSIFPANRSFGGFPEFQYKVPVTINYQGYQLKEFPMSTITILGKPICYSGGGYFRLFPYWKIKSIIRKNEYVMTYFHIKDFDKEQEKKYQGFNEESAVNRFVKNYYGLNHSFRKFSHLISDFNFMSVQQAESTINWKERPIVHL